MRKRISILELCSKKRLLLICSDHCCMGKFYRSFILPVSRRNLKHFLPRTGSYHCCYRLPDYHCPRGTIHVCRNRYKRCYLRTWQHQNLQYHQYHFYRTSASSGLRIKPYWAWSSGNLVGPYHYKHVQGTYLCRCFPKRSKKTYNFINGYKNPTV